MASIINADNGVSSGSAGLKYSADSSGVLELQTSGTATLSIDTSGNINIPGAGKRITGDFSNLTSNSRVAFQTSTINSYTQVAAIPNGTNAIAQFDVLGSSDATNASRFSFRIDGASDASIRAAREGTGTYLPLTMHTGGSERLRIDTSGNVGIGTSSPSYKLTIDGGAGTNSGIRIQASTTNVFSIGTGGSVVSGGAVTDGGTWAYANMLFATGSSATERMRIDSSGNVGIGTVPNAWASGSGVVQNSGGALWQFGSQNVYLGQNYYWNGSNRIYIASLAATEFRQSDGVFVFSTAPTGTAGNAVTLTERARINNFGIGLGGTTPSSGMGITFPATQSASSDANTLDDYEEGTWTPVPLTDSGSFTTTSVAGVYVKIGRQITVNGFIRIDNKGTANNFIGFSGLPFTSYASTNAGASSACREQQNTGVTWSIQLAPNATSVTMRDYANSAFISNGHSWVFTLTYETS